MSRKVALLIGNSTYGPGLPPLEKPDADIAALAKVLADPAIGGFDDVKPLLDANSDKTRREVARFFSGRSPDDLLLLYFSGHGLRNDRGGLYLAVQDTEAELLSGTAVPAAFISEEMDNCRSRRQILILDCCYSGAFERGAKGPAANPATAFRGNGLGRFVLTASDSMQLAWEDVAASSTGGLSVFTRHLVRGLESGEADLNGDGLISVDELYDYVYARVVEENPRQTPGKSTSKQQGEIFLARNPAGPKLRPLPAELMQALDHPLATVREGAVRELRRFLRGSDAGMAKSARKALEEARDDDSRRVAKVAAEILAAAFPVPADTAPLSESASESQPAPLTESVEGLSSAPSPTPSAEGSLQHVGQKSTRMSWIALAIFVVLATVALLISQANKHRGGEVEETPAVLPEPSPAGSPEPSPALSAETPAQPDATMTLLAEAKSWPLVVADNFDSAETSASGLPSNLNHDDKLGTRIGRISSGVLRLSFTPKTKKGGFSPVTGTSATTAADFYVRIDLSKSQGPERADAGLMFRANPDGVQHYVFLIRQQAYFLAAHKKSWHVLRYWTPSPAIRPGQTNSLAVVAIGSHLTLFINDQQVDQVSDATFSSGRMGPSVESHGIEPVTFDFDNFELRRKP
ncbi:MAG TPA: caspase family protein [Thermoanaerobaculia bacterium]|jgi:hypothetical protein|nr:caspase family protein [Thermoanaerobaculia bacterium]